MNMKIGEPFQVSEGPVPDEVFSSLPMGEYVERNRLWLDFAKTQYNNGSWTIPFLLSFKKKRGYKVFLQKGTELWFEGTLGPVSVGVWQEAVKVKGDNIFSGDPTKGPMPEGEAVFHLFVDKLNAEAYLKQVDAEKPSSELKDLHWVVVEIYVDGPCIGELIYLPKINTFLWGFDTKKIFVPSFEEVEIPDYRV